MCVSNDARKMVIQYNSRHKTEMSLTFLPDDKTSDFGFPTLLKKNIGLVAKKRIITKYLSFFS